MYIKTISFSPKLVRDNIPEIMRQNGQEPLGCIAETDAEYAKFLHEKLLEEADEFFTPLNTHQNQLEELADIMEIIYAIGKFYGLSVDDVERVRKEKLEKNGGFNQRFILSGRRLTQP